MGQVDVTINGQVYQLACDDGQESHLTQLANLVDRHVSGLAQSVGQVGDARLILMAALLLADELAEAHQEASPPARTQKSGTAKEGTTAKENAALSSLADTVDDLAGRLEVLASRLEAG